MTSKNRKIPLIVAAVVIAAVAVGTIVARRSGDPASQQGAQDSQAQDASAPPSTSAAPVRSANSGPLGAGDRQARLQETVARRQDARKEQIRKSAEQKKKAAEAFQREQVDPAWAPQKEVELNKIAAQPGFETAGAVPKDLRVECKSSMCRLDSSFASNGQAEDWILLYMSSVGSSMPNAVVSRVPNPDGTTRVEIYGRAR